MIINFILSLNNIIVIDIKLHQYRRMHQKVARFGWTWQFFLLTFLLSPLIGEGLSCKSHIMESPATLPDLKKQKVKVSKCKERNRLWFFLHLQAFSGYWIRFHRNNEKANQDWRWTHDAYPNAIRENYKM